MPVTSNSSFLCRKIWHRPYHNETVGFVEEAFKDSFHRHKRSISLFIAVNYYGMEGLVWHAALRLASTTHHRPLCLPRTTF